MKRLFIIPRLMIALTSFCLCFPGLAFAAQPAYPIDNLSDVGQVDWYLGTVNALGVSTMPSPSVSPGVTASPAAMKILTRFAAIEEAQRNLAKTIMAIPINANGTLTTLPNKDLSWEQVTEIVKRFKVADEKALPNAKYQVVLQVSLTGKNGAAPPLVNALKTDLRTEFPGAGTVVPPKALAVPETGTNLSVVSADTPTGLILELKDATLKRTFAPSIYDESDRLIYGATYITPDDAISRGFVQYTPEPEDIRVAEKVLSRVGLRPLTVSVVGLRDNDMNIVISVADAEQILALQNDTRFLDKCPVVIRQQQPKGGASSFITPKAAKSKDTKKKKKPVQKPVDGE